eukprot:m.244626 g.244626  ORF g.244626 m.244626 type:complete len:84 (+) comp16105_c0_seq24:566-817(+)
MLRQIFQQCEDSGKQQKARISAAETVTGLLTALRSGSTDTTKCIVIVLEEFDLFAHRGKQSLLYSLLDTAQVSLKDGIMEEHF